MKNHEIALETFSQVEESDVEWFWQPYVPFGKITLIQGDPSEGKSMLALKLAAIASVGGVLPDGAELNSPVKVIYQCLEDGVADTIKPRLLMNAANLGNVSFIKEGEEIASALDEETIRYAIKKTGARLFFMDPIQTILGRACHMNEVSSVRKYLDSLAAIANETGCGFVMIGHLNKNEYGKDLYRGIGSVDIVAAARSILRVERILDGASVRVLRHIKSNLSQPGDDFAFEIEEDKGINWIGTVNTSDECMELYEQSRFGQSKKLARMIIELRKMLSQKDMPYAEIMQRTNRLGSVRTINHAKKELGIKSVKKAEGWYWHLPEEKDASPT